MTTDNFCFYLQNRLIPTGQTGGQPYSDTSPFSIPWFVHGFELTPFSRARILFRSVHVHDSLSLSLSRARARTFYSRTRAFYSTHVTEIDGKVQSQFLPHPKSAILLPR